MKNSKRQPGEGKADIVYDGTECSLACVIKSHKITDCLMMVVDPCRFS